MLDLTLRCGTSGITVSEACAVLPHIQTGRRTVRALSSAMLRLVKKGILVRREEWFRPAGNPEGVGVRHRYWHVDHAPGSK